MGKLDSSNYYFLQSHGGVNVLSITVKNKEDWEHELMGSSVFFMAGAEVQYRHAKSFSSSFSL